MVEGGGGRVKTTCCTGMTCISEETVHSLYDLPLAICMKR